jgi:tetratricopeptide (TPR) repeat protein
MDPRDVARARDLGYRQQYDSALAITSDAIARDSSDPAAYYWHAAALQLLINDSGRGELADSFYALSDRAVKLCRQRLARNPDDVPGHLYLGLTELNRANFLGWQRRSMAAFRVFLGVAPHLSAALQRDSTLADAQLGLGMIEYYKVASDRYALGLRLMGSRMKAYAAVRPLADGNGPVKPAALMWMAYMLREDGDYDSAVSCCRRLLTVYPGNRSGLRLMRDVLFKAGRYAAAVQVGAEIDSLIPAAFPDNKYGMAENWIVCGKAYALMGQQEPARQRLGRVIAWEPYQDHVPWLPHYVREAKQWLKKL